MPADTIITINVDTQLSPATRRLVASLSGNLTFDEVTRINRERCERWHPGFPDDDWSGSDWSNAMQGEAGEAGNVVKKLRRLETGVTSKRDVDITEAELRVKLADEIADTFLYLDLLASYYEIDMPRAIVSKFNRVSREAGFPERLEII